MTKSSFVSNDQYLNPRDAGEQLQDQRTLEEYHNANPLATDKLVAGPLTDLLKEINYSNMKKRLASHASLQIIAERMDPDELAEMMMDQLICISWDYETDIECYHIARLSAVYLELFGKALERMTKARDWMLFIPFLANYLVKVLDTTESILVHKSKFSSNSNENSEIWDKTVILLANGCLDFVEFLHKTTVKQELDQFPLDTIDIGLENGDTKRRYLAYYLQNLIYEKTVLHFDMQISKTYFEKVHANYNIPKQKAELSRFDDPEYEFMFDIVKRCQEIAEDYSFSFEKMYQLQTSLCKKDHFDISIEDRISDDDRQMINSRLYPLSYNGIAATLSLFLFDQVVHSDRPNAWHQNISALSFAMKYIGIILNLLTRCTDLISQADKGVFVLLYLSDHIQTIVTVQDMEKEISGPFGDQDEFAVSAIIEVLSSVASTCPDASIRFLSYKLIEKFLNFGYDETRVFLLIELLDRCPFPSMKTATINLLKDQINQSYTAVQQSKTLSIFTSPLVVRQFFPLIFKSNWQQETFWDDYGLIMQSLNIYYYLLLKDAKDNLTTIWNPENIEEMKKEYLTPLTNLVDNLKPNKEIEFQDMQIAMMKGVIDKVYSQLEEK